MRKVGLLGFELESSNKGCEALSYAFIHFLQECMDEKECEIVVFHIHDTLGYLPEVFPGMRFKNIPIHMKKIGFWKEFAHELRSCDVIFDITHGDSFSDIYGLWWVVKTTCLKWRCLAAGCPLVLLPQTYGPFKNGLLKRWAMRVIAGSTRVYCRDDISCKYLKGLLDAKTQEKIKVYTDIAFALPYVQQVKCNDGRLRIGLNVSGLLWNACEKGAGFKLTTNYHDYCRKLIGQLTKRDNVELWLVPHVICDGREGADYYENDCRAMRMLLKEFPGCKFRSDFKTAMDVKSFISGLDCLIAGRMHATIAAYSAGVPCIPFAYSRKFLGLYDFLDYPYVVDGNTLETQAAVDRTLELIDQRESLERDLCCGMEKVNGLLNEFRADLKSCVQNAGKVRT